MKRTLKALVLLAALGNCTVALAAPLLDFTEHSLQQIERQRNGEDFLLVLWSVHCAPCFAELALLAEALRTDPALPIELVSTDAPDMRADVEATLERYGLSAHASWQFAENMPDKLRFHIDPGWYGELPRSYFYDAAQLRSGHSGALTREQLQDWLGARVQLGAK